MDEIKQLISKALYEYAFKKIKVIVKGSPDLENELLDIETRFNENKRERNRGHISYDNYIVTQGQIRNSLLDLISKCEMVVQNPKPKRIVFLTASVDDMESFRFEEEINIIQEKIQHYRVEKKFKFIPKMGVWGENILEILQSENPYILHISLHGTAEKGMFFQKYGNKKHPVTGSILADLIINLKNYAHRSIHCVLLNVCQSKIHADELHKTVDYAIGMDGKIPDTAATSFTKGFYTNLLQSDDTDISSAFNAGINQIKINKTPGTEESFKIPVLFKNYKL